MDRWPRQQQQQQHHTHQEKNLLPQGEGAEFICAQVKARADQFDQDQEMLLYSLRDSEATDVMTYSAIIKRLDMQLQRESEI